MPITFNPRPTTLLVNSMFPTFTAFTFTNAAATGPTGPSLLQLQTEYFGRADILSALVVNNGYQSYTIPVAGTYQFTLTGASGGIYPTTPPTNLLAPTIDGFKRAPGARVVGRYTLPVNAVITMVIGQGGVDEPFYNNPGGGGASFVTLGTYGNVVNGTDILLFAAGGGGGAGGSGTDNYSAGVGQSGTSGGSTTSVLGGISGQGSGRQVGIQSTGGAGYLTNAGGGTTSLFGASPQDGTSAAFRCGAVGSKNSGGTIFGGNGAGAGGFGGGGSGSSQDILDDNDKGGGGGYSGGGYAFDADIYAGGGGSYADPSATSVILTAGGNTTNRHGSVLLEFLG